MYPRKKGGEIYRKSSSYCWSAANSVSKRWLLANCFVILVKKGLLQEVDFKLHIKMINCCGKYTLEWCERGCGWPGCICIHEVAETSLRVLISYSRAEFARIKDRFGLHASIRLKVSSDQMGEKEEAKWS